MSQAAQRRMTPDEYLAVEEGASERHEYLAGEVLAMGGGTYAHDAISTAVAAELRTALRGKNCSAAGPNLRLLAQRSQQLLRHYREGRSLDAALCPLQAALRPARPPTLPATPAQCLLF